MSKTA
jgi:hypothetical protein